jgi:hypothetical protein
VYVNRPGWYRSGEREGRTDWYATRLLLFHDGRAIRESGRNYLARLRAEAAARTAVFPEPHRPSV